MGKPMTLKEMNLRVFRHQPIPHVLFQPRFEPWFDWNRQFGTLPRRLQGMNIRDAYDMLGASMRYVHYYTEQPDPVAYSYDKDVKVVEETRGELMYRQYITPKGTLQDVHKHTVDNTWRQVEFPVKGPDDLPAFRWLMERFNMSFNAAAFEQGSAFVGDRGVPQFWLPKSPYFALAQGWMKYENFIYAMMDRRGEVEEIMEVIDSRYDELYSQVAASGKVQIVNLGENIAMAYLSPDFFERYCLPWYEKRFGQLRAAGVYSHIHIDGYFKPLLPYLSRLPFDGLEALTPTPQGDVTLEEIRDNIGDKILLDGLPAVLFLSHHPREQLWECLEKVVEYFHPRLVLGISDELPEGGGEEAFNRMAEAAKWCQTHG